MKPRDLSVSGVKRELEKRNLGTNGSRRVLRYRLRQSLEMEGHNPEQFEFEDPAVEDSTEDAVNAESVMTGSIAEPSEEKVFTNVDLELRIMVASLRENVKFKLDQLGERMDSLEQERNDFLDVILRLLDERLGMLKSKIEKIEDDKNEQQKALASRPAVVLPKQFVDAQTQTEEAKKSETGNSKQLLIPGLSTNFGNPSCAPGFNSEDVNNFCRPQSNQSNLFYGSSHSNDFYLPGFNPSDVRQLQSHPNVCNRFPDVGYSGLSDTHFGLQQTYPSQVPKNQPVCSPNDIYLAQNRLYSSRQKQGEDLAVFLYSVRSQAQKAYPMVSDENLEPVVTQVFVEGMEDEILKLAVKVRQLDTSDEVLQFINSCQQPSQLFCFQCKNTGHKKGNCPLNLK